MEDAVRPRRLGAFVPSLAAATGILAWLSVTAVLSSLISSAGSGGFLPLLRLGELGDSTVLSAAFALAALVSFWLVAPIRAALRPLAVVGRALVAGLVAIVVMWPVEFSLLVNRFGASTLDQSSGLDDLVEYEASYEPLNIGLLALSYELQSILVRLPLYVLAALAVWWWLRRKEISHGEA